MASNVQDESSKTIGNKETDTYSSDTIYGKAKAMSLHTHSQCKVYPTLANGVTVTGHADAWTLGSKIEIVPASTITDHFDIHWIIIEAVSANDTYELVLYKGAISSEIEIGRIRFIKSTTAGAGVVSVPFQMEIVDGDTRISASLASSGGGSDTATISLGYHEY